MKGIKKAIGYEYTSVIVDCPHCECAKELIHSSIGEVEGDIETCESCGRKFEVVRR